MSKKSEDKKEKQKLEALLDALMPNVEEMTDEEVRVLLAEGEDLRPLRANLHTMAMEQAAAYRRHGHVAPKALTRFAEAMDDGPGLPADPAAAESKALRWIRSLETPGTAPAADAIRLLKAARKGDKELSERDKGHVDAAAARLKKKLDGDGTE